MTHLLRMIAGCVLPFLLIFLLPSLGISDMPAWEAAIGIVEILILGWLFGAVVVDFYNLGLSHR